MDVVIDNSTSSAMYVDKANNHIANSDEIIRFKCCDYKDIVDKYLSVISGFRNLTKTETAVLKHIINDKDNKHSCTLCIAVAKEINKSTATVARAISTLKNERLIYEDYNKEVKLSASILTDINTLSKAKFFIIEVNPEVTSPKVNI